MSLFPIIDGQSADRQQAGHEAEGQDPAAWLTNNSSFRPREENEARAPYGKYATQAEFLRAAERYLESSSDDDDGPEGAEHGRSNQAASLPAGRPARLPREGDEPPDSTHPLRHQRASDSPQDDGGTKKDRGKRKRSSRSPSRSKRRGHHKSEGKSRIKKRKRRRRGDSSGSSSDRSSGSSSDHSRRAAQSERAKILRLERAAAAAGLAPSQAAALTSSKSALLQRGGAATQPGDIFYDTRGDLQNLVYECLYGGNVASYHRTDPMGLARGARTHRLLPGQATYGRYGGDGDDSREASKAAARYFSGNAIAAERSRRLRRVYLAEAPVLPAGSGLSQRQHRGGGDRGAGSAAAGPTGWLLSRLEPPSAGAGTALQLGSGAGSRMAVPLPAFMPLLDPAAAAAAEAAGAAADRGGVGGGVRGGGLWEAEVPGAVAGESAEEWVLRRTREFNVAVREAPEDVPLWLRFAFFQDMVARQLARRAVEVAGTAAEKKLAILQRALDAHPGEPHLLRAMMAASEPLLDPEALLDRWERLLRRTPGEPSLWRDYLAKRRSAFASAKLSSLQTAYGNAMHSLASERARLQRQIATGNLLAEEQQRLGAQVSELDGELVRLVLELVELELGAGASEVAVARVQALVEFHCFAPGSLDTGVALGVGGFGAGAAAGGLRLSAGALLRLFDNFWEGSAPRVGEEGAVGWANWYRQQTEGLWVAKAADDEDLSGGKRRPGVPGSGGEDPRDAGGWSGWMELPLLPAAAPGAAAAGEAGQGGKGDEGKCAAALGEGQDGEQQQPKGAAEGEEDEASEEAEAQEEGEEDEGVQLTEEELLAQLGLRLDEQLEELQKQGVPPDILRRWLRTERERSAREWQPLRPPGPLDQPQQQAGPAAAVGGGSGGDSDGEAAADPHRVVLLDEVRDCIFPIQDPALRRDLLLACLALLGVPLAATPPEAPPAAAATGTGVGCYAMSYLRLLPPQAAVAVCQRHLPPPLSSQGATEVLAAGAAAPRGLGASPGLHCWFSPGVPWYLQDESRREFVARMLRTLVTSGPYMDEPQICLAYLLVEASKAAPGPAAASEGATAAALQPQLPPLPPLPCIDRARQAARGLLQERRNSVALLVALAAVEEVAGQAKAARRIRDAALAGAAGLPEQERRLLPLLVHQYADAERLRAAAADVAYGNDGGRGGRGGGGSSGGPPAALEAALRAHHVLRWFLGSGGGGVDVPYVPYKAGVTVTREEVAAARRGFEARIPQLLSCQDGGLDAPSASCLYLGGLFEVLTANLFPAAGGGPAAALTVFKHATAAVPAAVRRASGFHEALAVAYGGLMVSELETALSAAESGASTSALGLQPGRVRALLLQCLELYPHNAQLLALRVRLGWLAGAQCRLRRDLGALAAALRPFAEGSLEALAEEAAAAARREAQGAAGPGPGTAAASAAVWWAQLASELLHKHRPAGSSTAHLTGPSAGGSRALAAPSAELTDPRVSRLLERAASTRHLALVPPVWTCYLAHEAAAGRLGPAKRVFLRAVREVPLSKELWLLGLGELGCAAGEGAAAAAGGGVQGGGQQQQQQKQQQLSSREVSELLVVAADKGVRLRTDVYEVMLQHLAEQQ